MNYFEQYETERKHLKVGKRWICVDPGAIGQIKESVGEIVRIIDIGRNYCNFICLSGIFAGREYKIFKERLKVAYQPYIGQIPPEEEDNE